MLFHSELFSTWTKLQKTIWTYNREFMCQKSYFRVHTSFVELFSILDLHDINECGTPYMGISSRRTRPCTNRPERVQVCAH